MCTVSELIERLQELPPETQVYFVEVAPKFPAGVIYDWLKFDANDTYQFTVEHSSEGLSVYLGLLP